MEEWIVRSGNGEPQVNEREDGARAGRIGKRCAGQGGMDRLRTSFFEWMSHGSTSSMWKRWLHGSTRTRSPTSNSDRQIAHSFCVSAHGGTTSSVSDSDSSSPSPDAACFVTGADEQPTPPGVAAQVPLTRSPLSRSAGVGWWYSAGGDVHGPSVPGTAPVCFSQPLPVQTRHGSERTMSSGARSRRAARTERKRCTASVMKVRIDGRRRIVRKVSAGLCRLVSGKEQRAR
jgi:hypothetical protein